MITIITGHDAIEYAKTHNVTLNKYADPVERELTDISIDEAREVAAEDPSLIWVEISE